jgi:phenylacetate-CoA ligase
MATSSELRTAEMTDRIVEAFGVRPGRPVPDGEPGDRLLLTSLVNRTQPLIRFEVPDVVVLDSAPCACGRVTKRIVSVEGRRDDVVYLRGAEGRVAVHPMQFAAVSKDPDVREFQVVQTGQRLRVRVVLRDGARADEVSARVERKLTGRLESLGVSGDASVVVEACAGLPRSAASGGGKLKVVVADPAA